jgi:hypothetical protein
MKRRLSTALLFLLLAALACSMPNTVESDSISLTLTPMSAIIAGTATARHEEENSSNDKLATAIAKATSESGGIFATQTAYASLNDVSRLATSTAIAPVIAELPRYNVQPDEGYVAWIHAPAEIKLHGYQQSGYVNDYPQITAADFVLASDIFWHTRNSDSGCGFMFRSNGDQNKPTQYSILMTNTAGGYVGFLASLEGELANIGTFFPSSQDHSFNGLNDATNRLAIVVRGNLIDIYTNGVWIGQVDVTKPPDPYMPRPPAPSLPPNATQAQRQQFNQQLGRQDSDLNAINNQITTALKNFKEGQAVFTEGLLGMVGMSQSGDMTCTFNNTWLFIFNK